VLDERVFGNRVGAHNIPPDPAFSVAVFRVDHILQLKRLGLDRQPNGYLFDIVVRCCTPVLQNLLFERVGEGKLARCGMAGERKPSRPARFLLTMESGSAASACIAK
jgi:hypothetical protein